MTDAGRWTEIERLFERALEVPPAERRAWLAAQAASSEVRREVEGMLSGHARAEGILEASVGLLGEELVTAPDPVPRGLGPYEVVEEVGRGGMGVVYRAHDERLQRDVALKLLPGHLRADRGARERFLAEARAISALDHPNLCVVYDLGLDAEQLYIVMAFYEGETLGRILEQGALPWREAVRWVLQAADGLESAHAAGVVHRDIKPDNLLVTTAGTLKILDFGVAVLEKGGAGGATAGTPAYMSPEQSTGRPVDRRTDLWSLGVVLHEMLSGSRPFSGRDLGEIRAAALLGPPPLTGLSPPQPPGLQRVLDRLLAPDPGARYASAADLAADLRSLVDLSARRPPSFRRPLLPTPLTPCLGRERELAEIGRAASEARLLTLTGPGGSGKTRLALEAAHRLSGRFADGACFVPLGRLSSADLVPSAIARRLERSDTAARSSMEGILEALEHAEALLVLDNFEHLLEAAGTVTRLLATCPGVSVMVTSRVLLRAPGERSIVVPPLEVPQADDDDPARLAAIPAVRLFVERARALDPRFALDRGNAGAVAELCRRLEGIPLALELAAARAHVLSPRELLARLGAALDLPGAQSGPATGARHRTLRDAIAWSYALLAGPERALLRRLSAASGFDLALAERLAATPAPSGRPALESLETLVDHSLVVAQRSADGTVRFEMLELIRELAAEKLRAAGEEAAVRAAHALHHLALAEELKEGLTGRRQGESLDRLERDLPNMRAAFAWCLEAGEGEHALRLAASLWRLWMVRGPLREGERLLASALDLPVSRPPSSWRAEVLLGAANLVSSIGDPATARRFCEEALAVYRSLGDRRGEADALIAVGWVATELSDLVVARRYSEAGRELAASLLSRRALALAENNLGWIDLYEGRPAAAHRHLEAGLELRREIGDERGVAYAQINLAWAETLQGSLAQARRRLDEAGLELERLGDDLLLAWSLSNRGRLEYWEGSLERAEETLREALGLWRRVDHPSGLAFTFNLLAEVLNAQGRWEEAEAAALEASPRWERLQSRWGRQRVLTALGDAAAGRGDRVASRRYLAEAFTVAEQLGDGLGKVRSTISLARCSLEESDASRAATLLAAAREGRGALGIEPSAPDRVRERDLQEEIHQRLGRGRFRGVWRAPDP